MVLARVKTHLSLKASADFLRSKSDYLEQEVAKRTREISAIQDVTILAMASLAETRDNETGNHIRRTQHYVKALAEALRQQPKFAAELDDHTIAMLFKSAPLHDIGKVGIPDRILLKPGRYEPEEFAIMKRHPLLGLQAIEHAEQSLGMSVDFLNMAKEIAYGHHEKWDGSGYPQGLRGEDIPLAGRIVALSDVYDALRSPRPYKSAWSAEAAQAYILEQSGKQFDPQLVTVMASLFTQLEDLIARLADDDSDDLGELRHNLQVAAAGSES